MSIVHAVFKDQKMIQAASGAASTNAGLTELYMNYNAIDDETVMVMLADVLKCNTAYNENRLFWRTAEHYRQRRCSSLG
jgi:hypothetical protein